MFNVFRNIRRKLANENAIIQYTRYAIGEIVLVMVGILLALQVNNWNVERLEKIKEKNILEDLRVEFKENLEDAERVAKGNKWIYDGMSKLQFNTLNENYNRTENDSLMFVLFDWYDYTPKPGASNNLINSGKLDIISNEKLRNLLTVWTGIVAELEDDELVAKNYSQNFIVPFLVENYPLSNIEPIDLGDTYYNSKSNESIGSIILEPILYSVENLLKNGIFQSHVSAKKLYAIHNFKESQEVINTCIQVLELIDLELRQ